MIGTFNNQQSWEKQSVYVLDNGWTATLEYNSCYGEMISRLDAPKGQILASGKPYWHCSDGLKDLPDFARPWLEVVVKSCNDQLVRPGFDKIFKEKN